MSKVISVQKTRGTKKKTADNLPHEGFEPCSQDMTICGDCTDNRVKKKCPRLKEWLTKRQG